MFTLLLVSIILGGGTYFLYTHLFSNKGKKITPPLTHKQVTKTTDTSGFPMTIYFGSQSGTAEGFAFDLAKESKIYGFKAEVCGLENFDETSLPEKLVIYIVATYGEGDATDNSQEFYTWLSSSERGSEELENIDFAVFGLGDSQYEFYNKMGKQFDRLLKKLGGNQLIECGLGDASEGDTEDQFIKWKRELLSLISMKYLGKSTDHIVIKFEATIKIDYLYTSNNNNNNDKKKEKEEEKNKKTKLNEMALKVEYPYALSKNENNNYSSSLFLPTRVQSWMNRVILSNVVEKYETRSSNIDGSTLHVEFDVSNYKKNNPNFRYQTADNLGIITKNDNKMVEKLIKRLKLAPDDVILISPKNEQEALQLKVPRIVTIRNLFLWYLDINNMPKKQVIQSLSQFATDDKEKQELINLSKSGIENGKYETIVSLLEKYQSIDIDLASMIELLKPLQPRLYTISSSSRVSPSKISITIKLEQVFENNGDQSGFLQLNNNDTDDKKTQDDDNNNNNNNIIFNGACSRYISNMSVENHEPVQIFLQPSSFRLPEANIPVIMICTGAGLSPFRAFIQESKYIIEHDLQGDISKLAPWWLFFGCRYQNIDYLYKQELENALKSKNPQTGCLERLELAFSRQGKEKVYVQDLVKKNAEELYNLIEKKKAKIYVCGGTAMGKEIRNTINSILDKYRKNKKKKMNVDKMVKSRQYIQELWG